MVALLDGHPSINVIPEESDYFDVLYFFVNYMISKKMPISKKADIIYHRITNSTHIANLLKGKESSTLQGNFDYTELNKKEFCDIFKKYICEKGVSHRTVFEALALAYQSSTGDVQPKKYWLEKTPYHVINVNNREVLLDEMFQNYKVIHIIRDPRDNFLSYSRKRPELNIYDICFGWKRVANLALGWKNNENNLVIRYEDLVLEHRKTLNRILEFLDLPWNDCLNAPTKNGVPWLGNSMFGRKSNKVSSDRVNRYQTLLDNESRAIIESICSDEMLALGFALDKYKRNIPWRYKLAGAKMKYKELCRIVNTRSRLFYKSVFD